MLHRFSTEPSPGTRPRYWLLVILIQINNKRYPGPAPGKVPLLNPCSGWVPLYISNKVIRIIFQQMEMGLTEFFMNLNVTRFFNICLILSLFRMAVNGSKLP